MSIISTAQNANISNFPNSETNVSPDDFIITAASASRIEVELIVDGESLAEVVVEGQFSNYENVVGLTFTEGSAAITGAYTRDVSTFLTSDGDTGTETLVYDPPMSIEPTTTFVSTYEEEASMYAGNDVFIGDASNPIDDTVHGYGGNDRFTMTYGNEYGDKFRGGDGVDIAVMPSAKANWEIFKTATLYNALDRSNNLDGYVVRDINLESVGRLEIAEVERLEFTDVKVALDLDGSAGQTAKTLAAVIGEEGLSNKEYVGIGLQLFDAGQSLSTVCERALTAVGATTNEAVVNLLYTNLYGEAPTADVAQPFIDALNNGGFTKGSLAAAAAELTDDEGVIDLVGLAETGIEYV